MSREEHLVEVNEGEFEKEVLESGIPVLVDFFTPPCAPCKALVPVLERAARKYPNVKVVKVNAWNNQRLCARWKIVGVPALLFFKFGQNVLRIDGFDDSTEKRIEDGLDGILES
jgi:thioredoxin-like negative regulator of GroEL